MSTAVVRSNICPAQHAEANAIVNAARNGVSTLNASIFLVGNSGPCKSCAGTIINAGIVEVVFDGEKCYDDLAQILFDQAGVKLRPLNGE
jgi:deoxycytidylate deaminase